MYNSKILANRAKYKTMFPNWMQSCVGKSITMGMNRDHCRWNLVMLSLDTLGFVGALSIFFTRSWDASFTSLLWSVGECGWYPHGQVVEKVGGIHKMRFCFGSVFGVCEIMVHVVLIHESDIENLRRS